MKRLLAILAVLLMAGCTLPVHMVRNTTHRLTIKHEVCSATAVGRHTILTASHCMTGGPVMIDGNAVAIDEIMQDGHDHTLIVTTTDFGRHAYLRQRVPRAGTKIFYYGQAMGLHNMLREGIVAGAETRHGKTVVMLDVNGWGGDSGAGVFNAGGWLVGMITYRFG